MKIFSTSGLILALALVCPLPLFAGGHGGHGGGGGGFSSGGGSRGSSGGYSGAHYSSGGARFSGYSGARYGSSGMRYSGTRYGYSGVRSYNGMSSPRFNSSGARYSTYASRYANNLSRTSPANTFNQQNLRNRGTGTQLNNTNNRIARGGESTLNNHATGRGTGANWNGRLAGNRANHVFATHNANWHSNWDRHHDHHWNGHCCRWVHNCWVVFDVGFIPWDFWWPWWWDYPYYGYNYYPYGGYGYDSGAPYDYQYEYGDQPPPDQGYSDQGYSDQGYSDQGYSDQGYSDQGAYQSYQHSGDSTLSAVQAQLRKRGYYYGSIDGHLGPHTRSALRRFQSDNHLQASGYVNGETLHALGLKEVASN